MPDMGFDFRRQEARGSMDAKRRTVVDPKVRMVGFVTPGTDMTEVAMTQAPGMTVPNSSPSPVIIPPPQKESVAPVPLPVPSPSQGPPVEIEFLSAGVGSCNPLDSLLGSSSSPARKTGSDNNGYDNMVVDSTSELSPLKPLTATTGDRIGERLLQPLDPLASSMPAKTGIAGVIPGKASKPVKERTSRAVRHAKQEAECAAKTAAKESGFTARWSAT